MAVINGARSYEEVVETVKAGFFSVIRVSRKYVFESRSNLTLSSDLMGRLSIVDEYRAELPSCGGKFYASWDYDLFRLSNLVNLSYGFLSSMLSNFSLGYV
jgi:hypothetical protein